MVQSGKSKSAAHSKSINEKVATTKTSSDSSVKTNHCEADAASDAESIELDHKAMAHKFLNEFYQMLSDDPKEMYRFYDNGSTLYRDGVFFTGRKCVVEYIASLHINTSVTRIFGWSSVPTIENSILVQTLGDISINDEPFRKFAQSFVLSPAKHKQKKFYVRSDVQHFTDDLWNHVISTFNRRSLIVTETIANSASAVEGQSLESVEQPETALLEKTVENLAVSDQQDQEKVYIEQPAVGVVDAVEADEQNTDIKNVALTSNMDAEAAPFVPIAVQQQNQTQIKGEPTESKQLTKTEISPSALAPVNCVASTNLSWACIAASKQSQAANIANFANGVAQAPAIPGINVAPHQQMAMSSQSLVCVPTNQLQQAQTVYAMSDVDGMIAANAVTVAYMDQNMNGPPPGTGYQYSQAMLSVSANSAVVKQALMPQQHGGMSTNPGTKPRYPHELQVYVRNFPIDVSKGEMIQYFSAYGFVTDVDILFKGTMPFAFVTFQNQESVQKVMMKNHCMRNAPLKVERKRYFNDNFRYSAGAPLRSASGQGGGSRYNFNGGGGFHQVKSNMNTYGSVSGHQYGSDQAPTKYNTSTVG